MRPYLQRFHVRGDTDRTCHAHERSSGRGGCWCMMWCMKRTNIYLDEGQAAALEQVARTQGISRAELIRQLIDRSIGASGAADLDADLAAIRDSFGIARGKD